MGLQWENMQKFVSHWCEYLTKGLLNQDIPMRWGGSVEIYQ